MSEQREELVRLMGSAISVSDLCRRWNVSRQTAYKWRRRFRVEGTCADQSRRPRKSPEQTLAPMEAEVLRVRAASNGAWGGRKIRRALRNEGSKGVPAPSTITAILRRHEALNQDGCAHPGPHRRFERAQPNELWPMDFKGHFALTQGRCHPLDMLDDHSRFSPALTACSDEREETVRAALIAAFRSYGLPLQMLMDNGAPWGEGQRYTGLVVWLMRRGIRVSHGRAYHPQTQGKQERFHRSLKAEVLNGRSFGSLADCQKAFNEWRHIYNYKRPHDTLDLAVPASRYSPSPRSYPEVLEPIDYGPGAIVRKVQKNGLISFNNRPFKLPRAFTGAPVALRPTSSDGVFDVHFCAHRIATIDLRANPSACGLVDNAPSPSASLQSCNDALPTTPQALQPQQPLLK